MPHGRTPTATPDGKLWHSDCMPPHEAAAHSEVQKQQREARNVKVTKTTGKQGPQKRR